MTTSVEQLVEWELEEETKVLGGGELDPMPLCPPLTPPWPKVGSNSGAPVGSRRLTAWAYDTATFILLSLN
jgi:hypothetical protein